MSTEQKLQQIVDRLLIKTQDNLCDWKPTSGNKFILRTNNGLIHLYAVISESPYIMLDVFDNTNTDIILISAKVNKSNKDFNLVRLFEAVYIYHQNYVDSYIDNLISELQKYQDSQF